MSNVYIVKSGNCYNGGWEWTNLRAFTDYDRALQFESAVLAQIEPENMEVSEDVYIDTLELVE
jgi:hypothetical protein